MQHPELPREGSTNLSENAKHVSPAGEDAKSNVQAVLRYGSIEDATERELVIAAAKFVESPSENLAEIDGHMRNVSEVLTGFMMTGADAPPEVDALHADLLELFCQHHIDVARAQLASAEPDNAALDLAIRMALDSAKNLSKGYKIPSYLEEVEGLQRAVTKLRGS